MGRIWDWVSSALTARPWWTLAVLAALTVVLGAGTAFRAPLAYPTTFLPPDSNVATTARDLDTLFSESAHTYAATVVFRGEVLSPAGLAQIDRLLAEISADPRVAATLTEGNSIVSPTTIVAAFAGTDEFDSVGPDQIASAVAGIESDPEAMRAFDRLYGVDEDGTEVAVAYVVISSIDGDRFLDAQLAIEDLAGASVGPVAAISVSSVTGNEDLADGTTRSLPFVGLALVLIGGLVYLFLRRISDLIVTVLGILVSVIWILGAEGWLGPNALALIGPPNVLSAMVPIIILSLSVDYAIQAVARYRERLIAGDPPGLAARTGLRLVLIPLTLAAATTALSFATGLLSPIEAIGDFGIVAGLGIALSLVVMMSLVPAANAIIDRRRESRGTLAPPRAVSDSLPGLRRAARMLGGSISQRATPYIIGVIVASFGFGYAATGVSSDFSINDLLPSDSRTFQVLETMDAAVGGASGPVNVLVRAEITDTRTFLNIFEMTDALSAASRPVEASLGVLVRETITPGSPDYDPEVAAAFADATAGLILDRDKLQSFLDLLAAKNPDGVRRVLINNAAGEDAMVLRFSAAPADNAETQAMLDEIDDLWFGSDAEVGVASAGVFALELTEGIRDFQTLAILTTLIAALIILALFFWATEREPVLAVIAVIPVLVALIWVIGTMSLLGIPYTPITSIITALCVGVGVDYTIHLIHRYREQFTAHRSPETAAAEALETTGAALLGSAATTAVGFGVLGLSPAPMVAQFGFVTAITIGHSLLVSVLLVPPAMAVWGAFRNMRLQSMVERMWSDLDETIERTHAEYEGA